ncbi:hypothetical protein B0H15DRAFT_807474 [Mycena belliarum]|uniref:Uncharacterized protein n=1 Tax=Mycena belliarum TaxID=1033014 RepID=A0AAD6TRC4_9AGAR|nr:hypothetical protein B0H15DRAFT_807605 [Mycena belliae]KAJ7067711.1 hypothetical protein B0H15DRAFT_807474 [Mycena belliae]
MTRFEQALAPLAPIYCVPEYFPDDKNPHTIAEHGTAPDCLFFALLEGENKGIYFDFSQILCILCKAPETPLAIHRDWIGINEKWQNHCSLLHDHFDEVRALPRNASPPGSASAFETSPPTTPIPSRTPSPSPNPKPSASAPFFDPPSSSRCSTRRPSPIKKPLETEPSSRRPTPPSPVSSTISSLSSLSSLSATSRRRTPVPFAAVKGAPHLRFPKPVLSPQPRNSPAPVRLPNRPASPPQYREATQEEDGDAHLAAAAARIGARRAAGELVPVPAAPAVHDTPLVMYAISLHRLLFKSHAAAFELFDATEGAAISLVSTVEEAANFFERTDPAAVAPSADLLVYAVSGHRTIYKRRASAFKHFMQGMASVMLFSRTSREAEIFILKYSNMY